MADLDGSGLADVGVTDIGDGAIRVFLNPAVAAVPDDGGRESVIKRSGREGGRLEGSYILPGAVSLNDLAFGDEPVVIYTHERLRAGGGYGLLISRFEGSIPSRRTNFPAEFPS